MLTSVDGARGPTLSALALAPAGTSPQPSHPFPTIDHLCEVVHTHQRVRKLETKYFLP